MMAMRRATVPLIAFAFALLVGIGAVAVHSSTPTTPPNPTYVVTTQGSSAVEAPHPPDHGRANHSITGCPGLLAAASCSRRADAVAAESGASDLTTVGRWMSAEEHDAMVASGKVQPGRYSPHTDVASPADVSAYAQSAAPGTRYVESSVPRSSLVQGGKEGWAHIPGPESIFSRLSVQRGGAPFEYPAATDIQWIASKIGWG